MRNILHRVNLFVVFFVGLLLYNCKPAVESETNKVSLKDAYSDLFYIGTAMNTEQILGNDTVSLAVLLSDFNSITNENCLKWEKVHPLPGQYDFALADKFVDFGEKNNMFIIGHCLLWHSQTPDWVFKDKNGKPVSRDTLLARLKDHIFTVVGRYKGRVDGWDVVNEAFEGDGSYRDTPWKRIIGEEYIQYAFEYAYEADSTAELYYNDFNMPDKGRRDAVVKMVNNLKAKGIKVDGIGMQGHYVLDYPVLKDLEDAIVAFGRTGAKVMFTEMEVALLPFPTEYIGADVDLSFEHKKELDPYTEGLPDSINVMQASRYADFFRIFVKHADIVSRVTLWGISDAQSWKNNWPVPGRTDYPLLFDRNFKPKAAYDSIINCAKTKQAEL